MVTNLLKWRTWVSLIALWSIPIVLTAGWAQAVLKGGVSEQVTLQPGWHITVEQANGAPAARATVTLPQVGWSGVTESDGRLTVPRIPHQPAVIKINGAEQPFIHEPLWEVLPSPTTPPSQRVFTLSTQLKQAIQPIDDQWHHLGDGRFESWSLGAQAFQLQTPEGSQLNYTFTCPASKTQRCILHLGAVLGLDTLEAHRQAGTVKRSTASPLQLRLNQQWSFTVKTNGTHYQWILPPQAIRRKGPQTLQIIAGSHRNVLGQLDYDDCELGGLWVSP